METTKGVIEPTSVKSGAETSNVSQSGSTDGRTVRSPANQMIRLGLRKRVKAPRIKYRGTARKKYPHQQKLLKGKGPRLPETPGPVQMAAHI